MRYDNRNRNEFYTLLGAIYAFVAYLTAFTIETLFIIDLAKRDDAALGLDFLSKAKSLLAIACFAIAILYFIIFLSSLILIVALIMRSTMCIIIWLIIKMVLYLPEFALIVYVSVYEWGLDSRNGQTEIIFYAIRAILDVIFIFKGHQLYKDWKFDKNFFRFDTSRFNGYDSPYFIGDSLTTTINPVFSSPHFPSSTPHTDRYDYVRQLNSGLSNRLGRENSDLFRDDLPESSCADCDIGQRQYNHYKEARSQSQQRINYLYDADRKYHHHQYRHHRHSELDPAFMNPDYYPEPDYNTESQSKIPGMTYATQSLDRRNLKDNTELALPEQVILRPLNHRPFDYLDRPGSTANLQSYHDHQQVNIVPGDETIINTNSSSTIAGNFNRQQQYTTKECHHIKRYNSGGPFSYLSTANPLHPHYKPRTTSRSPIHAEAYRR